MRVISISITITIQLLKRSESKRSVSAHFKKRIYSAFEYARVRSLVYIPYISEMSIS